MDREIGKKIKELRTEQGMSQEDLALEANIPRQTMSYIEQDRQTIKYNRLCDILEVLGYEIQIVKANNKRGEK